jgi:hypothetical protein
MSERLVLGFLFLFDLIFDLEKTKTFALRYLLTVLLFVRLTELQKQSLASGAHKCQTKDEVCVRHRPVTAGSFLSSYFTITFLIYSWICGTLCILPLFPVLTPTSDQEKCSTAFHRKVANAK